jgi:hypothetical protein
MGLIRYVLAVSLCVVGLYGQIGTSTITGRVTDSTGAVVPSVNVSVVQPATNFTFTATTNNEGLFRVSSLNVGMYRVSFEAQGFKKVVRDNVELRTGDVLAVDATLQVGNVAESIEISGAPPVLETETSATGTVMSGNVLYEMPLYQRYINSTLNLVPGMSSSGFAYGGDLGAYHLAGLRNGAIGIFEDGVNGNSQDTGTATIKPIQSSVAEVKVVTTVPPAEYGHSAGGVISVVKKSGTNELHGMASWYGRTRSMQHRRFFDLNKTSAATATRPNGLPVFFMQPDANIGGPVYIPKLYDGRNKTFFFFGYQRLHEKKVAQFVETTPTPEMLAGNFNFPGVNSNQIFDPASTRQNADGTWARDPFPGNIVPQNRFDPVARNVLGYDPWVRPNQPGGFNTTGPTSNYLADEFARVFFDDFNLRLDHQFSTSFKLYGSFTQNSQSGINRPRITKPGLEVFDHGQGHFSPFHQSNTSAGYTWVASPSVVNDSRVGYYRRFNKVEVPSFGGDWATKLGIPNLKSDLMPAFNAATLTLNGNQTQNRVVNETVSFRNDTTWVNGKHAFKFGYEVLRFRLNNAVAARPPSFNFGSTTGLQANGNSAPNTGNTLAGFLTGYVSTATITQDLSSWLTRSSIHSFYFQDDWKVTPTLTANLGVRYSTESPFTTKYKGMSNFDPTATDPLTGRLGAIVHPTSGLNKRDTNNFNPRVGLAWHPKAKWVIRGGIGMYTVDVKFPASRIQYDEYTATANQARAPGDPRPIYQISRGPDPFTFTVLPNGTSPFLGTNYSGRGAAWWDPNLRNAYTLTYNANVQYELKRNYLLEISYQGSAGVGLIENWETNTFPIDIAAGNSALRSQILAATQNYRPFTNFGNTPLRSNYGHSTFHSGTIKLEKRYSDGFFFNTFYTMAKALDSQDGDNNGSGIAPIQNRGLEKARAGYDRKHRFVGTVNYELPFGKGKKFANSGGWKNYLIGGFELSWIQTIEAGNPVNFGFGGSPYNYWPGFAGSQRPNVLRQPNLVDGWRDFGGDRFNQNGIRPIYDINAFAYPGGCPAPIPAGFDRTQCDFRIGNAGRNIGQGMPLIWSQVSAQKNFAFGERWKAQLRWDFQNALKTYNFNAASNSVNFLNPATFAKVSGDPTTASLGGQPLMNLTLMISF